MAGRAARRVRAASAVVALWASGLACQTRQAHVATARLTFESVSFDSQALGQPLTAADMAVVERVARDELRHAFGGLRVTFTRSREARYLVTVTQQVRDPMRADMSVAGASRAVSGFGGSGVVNFQLLAGAAISCRPAGASRAQMVDAIGRGVGRAAAHELAHQFLPTAPIHDSKDVESYEYASASRCQQYAGPMHWDIAGPLLRERLGQ